MPILLDPELEATVRCLNGLKYSSRAIVMRCRELGWTISQSGVQNIIKTKGLKRQAKQSGEQYRRKGNRSARTIALVKQVKAIVKQENPPSQRALAARVGTSKTTIGRIIHEDAGLQTRRKTQVHRLTQDHKDRRAAACKRLLRTDLRQDRLEFAVTLDEGWLYLQDCDQKSEICYIEKGTQVPEDWVKPRAEVNGPKIMVVGVITGRGTGPLFVIPEKAKICSKVYIDQVLRPLVDKFLPEIYPGELDKLWVHHDAAPSHTSRETARFLADVTEATGIRFIKRADIPVKGPDVSPLDFFGFGYIKQLLAKRRIATLRGLARAARQEWANIEKSTILNVYQAWRRRAQIIIERQGSHVEQTKQIHRRALNIISQN